MCIAESNFASESSMVLGPTRKKRRRKIRCGVNNEALAKIRETTLSKTAGILFYAGRGLINGITGKATLSNETTEFSRCYFCCVASSTPLCLGAFYQKKEADEKPSRQAEALIDDLPANTRKKYFRRTKSTTELPPIKEVDTSYILPHRPKSCTDIKSKNHNVHNKTLGRFA